VLVPQGIHVLPVPLVIVNRELTLRDQASQRILLPHCLVMVDVIDDAWLADKETAVDEAAVSGGLFAESVDLGSVRREIQSPEPTGLVHSSDGREPPLFAVEAHKRGDVDITYSITVGQTERLITNVLTDTFDAPTCHCRKTGIHKSHTPWL
jgi:hypothetical protein